MAGDDAKACAAYQDFLTLRKDVDPNIPILKQAKAGTQTAIAGLLPRSPVLVRDVEAAHRRFHAGYAMQAQIGVLGFYQVLVGINGRVLLLMKNFPPNVRPEFFQDVRNAIYADLRRPLRDGIPRSAFDGGIVGIREGGTGTVSDNFGEIEAFTARIGPRDYEPTNRIFRSVNDSAVAQRVIARIFARQTGNYCLREIVADGLICESMPVIPSITRGTLVKLGIGFRTHRITGQHASNDERRVIKAVLSCENEFVLDGERRQLAVGAYGPIIGNNPENPLRLPAFGIIARLCILRRSCGGRRCRCGQARSIASL